MSVQRQKQPPVGIAAGAEDAKYHAKYKELKRKVKDIEADNDKLHFKVLQAKLTIRRMKMERAILYERLSTVPPSPNLQDRNPLPPMAILQPGSQHPAHAHLRPPPQNRDYPFHPTANIDFEHQRIPGPPLIVPDNIRHYQNHHHHPGRSGPADPRVNPTSLDNQPVLSSPRLPVHSPQSRISSAHEHQPQHTVPPTSASYESRATSNVPHTSPPVSHHNTHITDSNSRKRSHSHSSPRPAHPHQIELAGHIHAAQPYRVLSGGPNNNGNPGHISGSGSVTPAVPLGQPPLHQYSENLAPVQQPLHSPPLSELDFERAGRAHPHLHLAPQHPHPHSGGGGHQHPHSHHHHVVHHHHQHNQPHPPQAQAQNEYGGGLPVGDPPTSSASPAIQAHGTGYETAGSRGTGPPGSASVTSAVAAASASGTGRTHAHQRERVAYEYPSTTQPEGKRERERESDKDPDREWERERDRAREYSRGELINYSPHHHQTRSSQSQSQSRPLSRAHSQSHPASGGRSQSQISANQSGEYEHSTSRTRPVPSSGAPQAQYPEDPHQVQGYRDYPPPESNKMHVPRFAPSSRAATPPSSTGSGSTVGATGPDSTNNLGPRDRDRDREREAAQRDRGRQPQAAGPPPIASPGGTGDSDANDHHGALDSGRKRNRNEMEMEVDEEVNNEFGKGRRNGPGGGTREISLQPQDDSRGGKRYHRQADSSPERERR